MPNPQPIRPSSGRPPVQPGGNSGQASPGPLPEAQETLTDDNYVDMAETVMKWLWDNPPEGKRDRRITTSKIRNLLSLTADIYTQLTNLPSDSIAEVNAELQYLRVQFIYQAGRENAVKDLIDKADILAHLKRIKSKGDALRFCRFMEALTAYKKYLDPDDK